MNNLQSIIQSAVTALNECQSIADLEKLKRDYLGKNSQIMAIFKDLKNLSGDAKIDTAKQANVAKKTLSDYFEQAQQKLAEQALQKQLATEKIDVTLPGDQLNPSNLHPVTQTIYQIEDIFSAHGFRTVEDLEIEDDYHNFTALNIAANHPARAMHDTFYLSEQLLLRTHTSSVQIRAVEKSGLPIKIIAPGRVFRCDSDQTHTPMFHQCEGLFIDQQVSFTDLQQMLTDFLKTFFADEQLQIRFRPSFFPFTEPSAEVDIYAKELGGDEWLEVLGCGMVHPKVIEGLGYNSQKWQGYAFGLGIERLAMLKYHVSDLRQFFINDLRFLNQFNEST